MSGCFHIEEFYFIQGSKEYPNKCLFRRLYNVNFTSFTLFQSIVTSKAMEGINDVAKTWYERAG